MRLLKTLTKKFTGTIHKISKVDKETIESYFTQGMVIKEWAKTSNVAFSRLQQIISNEIADSFFAVANYKQFNIETFADKW